MDALINKMKKMMTAVVIAVALGASVFTPVPAQALPAVACIDDLDCGGGESCGCLGGTACSQGGSCVGVGVPEMSDYLAVAFVIVAGIMIFRMRRRTLAAA